MDKLQSKPVSVNLFSGDRGYVEKELKDWLSKDDRVVLDVLLSGEASSVTIAVLFRN